MGIWDEDDVDWSTGAGLPVRQLFERAYDDADAALAVADAVGIALAGWRRCLTRSCGPRCSPRLRATQGCRPSRPSCSTTRAAGLHRPAHPSTRRPAGLANAVSVASADSRSRQRRSRPSSRAWTWQP